MQIFQTIWTAMTTQNEIALSIVGFLSCFIEAIVSMLLFTTVFNMLSSRKTKITYILSISVLGYLFRMFTLILLEALLIYYLFYVLLNSFLNLLG